MHWASLCMCSNCKDCERKRSKLLLLACYALLDQQPCSGLVNNRKKNKTWVLDWYPRIPWNPLLSSQAYSVFVKAPLVTKKLSPNFIKVSHLLNQLLEGLLESLQSLRNCCSAKFWGRAGIWGLEQWELLYSLACCCYKTALTISSVTFQFPREIIWFASCIGG